MSHLNINGVDKPLDHVYVKARTENLFDKDNITDAGQLYIGVTSGGASASLISSSNTCMFMLPCKPNTTYTVKRYTITKRFVIGFVDDGNLYSGMPVTAFAYKDTADVLTATSTADSRYLLVYYAKKGGSDASTAEEIQSCLDTLMVVEGSTAPSQYVPYLITKEAWEARDKNDNLLWGRADTFTGTNSISARCYGLPVKSWEIDGNTQQSGTPVQDDPIMPEFVGEKTKNLLPLPASDTIYGVLFTVDSSAGTVTASGENQYTGSIVFNLRVPADVYGDFYLSGCPSGGGNSTYNIIAYDRTDSLRCKKWDGTTASENDNGQGNVEVKIVQGHTTDIQVRIATNYNPDNIVFYPMLRVSTASADFEPYGYKLDITSAGQTTPVYLGQVPTTRRVKKLVFDGTENWEGRTSYTDCDRFVLQKTGFTVKNTSGYCSHFEVSYYLVNTYPLMIYNDGVQIVVNYSTKGTTTLAQFKQWLADQYASGTPVTAWYVLAEQEIGIVNEPLAKIDTYTDTLTSEQAGITIPTIDGSTTISVDTTLAPSKFEVKVHAKPT